MMLSTPDIPKKRGRPKIPNKRGRGEAVLVRLQPDALGRLDGWAAGQEDAPSRPEAIRRLIERGLAAPEPKQSRPVAGRASALILDDTMERERSQATKSRPRKTRK